MTTLTYLTHGSMLSTAGRATVLDGDREVATVTVRAGGFRHGPRWTWEGPSGPEWTMTASQGDRLYELRRSDDTLVGTMRRGFVSSAVEIETARDGRATVDPRAAFQREQTVQLPNGTAVVRRETHALSLSSSARWSLRLQGSPPEGELHAMLLALPLALDHRRRRQRSGGAAAGGGA